MVGQSPLRAALKERHEVMIWWSQGSERKSIVKTEERRLEDCAEFCWTDENGEWNGGTGPVFIGFGAAS